MIVAGLTLPNMVKSHRKHLTIVYVVNYIGNPRSDLD